jgi:hypothetical protein
LPIWFVPLSGIAISHGPRLARANGVQDNSPTDANERTLLSALLLAASFAAHGDEELLSKQYGACMNAPNVTTTAGNAFARVMQMIADRARERGDLAAKAGAR